MAKDISERIRKAQDKVMEHLDYILETVPTPDFVEIVGSVDGDIVTYRVYDDGSVYGKWAGRDFRMRLDYRTEEFQKVSVCGIVCDFSDMRIDRSTVPKDRYQYEVADDDESQGEPSRVRRSIMVNFFGTLICDVALPLKNDNVLWLHDGDFEWL